jgi:hypothetical protein
MKMSTEHLWNDTNRRKPTNWEKNIPQCQVCDHIHYMDWPREEPGPRLWTWWLTSLPLAASWSVTFIKKRNYFSVQPWPNMRQNIALYLSYQVSYAFPSDKSSSNMKVRMEYGWNDNDEICPSPIFPPQIAHKMCRNRTRTSEVRGWRLFM